MSRALRQPQLRGPHQPRREDELPRVAAAVVAYALAGTMDIDLLDEPLGQDADGEDVYLKDIWPSRRGGRAHGRGGRAVGHVHVLLRRGVRRRRALELARGARGRPLRLGRRLDLRAPAAVLRGPAAASREPVGTSRARACWPCSATRSRPTTSRPRARSRRTRRPRSTSTSTASSSKDFNSYGSRRGNHEVMMRGTFANIRLRNLLAGQELEGGLTQAARAARR